MTFMIVQNFSEILLKFVEKNIISNIKIYSFYNNCSFTVKVKTISEKLVGR